MEKTSKSVIKKGTKSLAYEKGQGVALSLKTKDLSEKIANSPRLALSETLQLKADVWSTAAYADPTSYLQNEFEGETLKEDGGSGGILDIPMQKLVSEIIRPVVRRQLMSQLREAGEDQMANHLELVYDGASAFEWITRNSLRLSQKVPDALSYYHEIGGKDAETHTFHKDHGFVKLTHGNLSDAGLNSQQERARRISVGNGPWENGWIQGHWGIDNNRHRFIEHIHVDKDKSQEERFEIYNADNANRGNTADGHNVNNRVGFSAQNNGKADQAVINAEGGAKKLAWENYVQALDPKPPYFDGEEPEE